MRTDPFTPGRFGFEADPNSPGYFQGGSLRLNQIGDFVTIWAQTLAGDLTPIFAGYIRSNGLADVLFSLYLPLLEYDISGIPHHG